MFMCLIGGHGAETACSGGGRRMYAGRFFAAPSVSLQEFLCFSANGVLEQNKFADNSITPDFGDCRCSVESLHLVTEIA